MGDRVKSKRFKNLIVLFFLLFFFSSVYTIRAEETSDKSSKEKVNTHGQPANNEPDPTAEEILRAITDPSPTPSPSPSQTPDPTESPTASKTPEPTQSPLPKVKPTPEELEAETKAKEAREKILTEYFSGKNEKELGTLISEYEKLIKDPKTPKNTKEQLRKVRRLAQGVLDGKNAKPYDGNKESNSEKSPKLNPSFTRSPQKSSSEKVTFKPNLRVSDSINGPSDRSATIVPAGIYTVPPLNRDGSIESDSIVKPHSVSGKVNGEDSIIIGTQDAFNNGELFLVPYPSNAPSAASIFGQDPNKNIPVAKNDPKKYYALDPAKLLTISDSGGKNKMGESDQKKNEVVADYLGTFGASPELTEQIRNYNTARVLPGRAEQLRDTLLAVAKQTPTNSEGENLRNITAKLTLDMDKTFIKNSPISEDSKKELLKSYPDEKRRDYGNALLEIEANREKALKEYTLNNRGNSYNPVSALQTSLQLPLPIVAQTNLLNLSSHSNEDLETLTSLKSWKQNSEFKQGAIGAMAEIAFGAKEETISNMLLQQAPKLAEQRSRQRSIETTLFTAITNGNHKEAEKILKDLSPEDIKKLEPLLQKTVESRIRYAVGTFKMPTDKGKNLPTRDKIEESLRQHLQNDPSLKLALSKLNKDNSNAAINKLATEHMAKLLQDQAVLAITAERENTKQKLLEKLKNTPNSKSNEIKKITEELHAIGELAPYEYVKLQTLIVDKLSIQLEAEPLQNAEHIAKMQVEAAKMKVEERISVIDEKIEAIQDKLKSKEVRKNEQKELTNTIAQLNREKASYNNLINSEFISADLTPRINEQVVTKEYRMATYALEKASDDVSKYKKAESELEKKIENEQKRLDTFQQSLLDIADKPLVESLKIDPKEVRKARDSLDEAYRRAKFWADSKEVALQGPQLNATGRSQSLAFLIAAGVTVENSESILKELDSKAREQREKNDSQLATSFKELESKGVHFNGRSFEITTQSEISGVATVKLLQELDQVSKFQYGDSDSRYGDEIRYRIFSAIQNGHEYVQIGYGATFHITDPAKAIQALRVSKSTLSLESPENIEMEGLSIIPPKKASNEAQPSARKLQEILVERQLINKRTDTKPEQRAKDLADNQNRIQEESHKLRKFGNVTIEIGNENDLQHAPALAFVTSVRDSESKFILENINAISRSMNEKDAKFRTTVGTTAAVGTLVGLSLFTGGSSLLGIPAVIGGNGVLATGSAVVGGVATGYLSTRVGYDVSHKYNTTVAGKQSVYSYEDMESQAIRAGVLGGATGGFSKAFSTLGYSSRASSVFGAVSAAGIVSKAYGDDLYGFTNNLGSAFAFAAVGAHLLPKTWGTSYGAVGTQVLGANIATSAAVGGVQLALSNGNYKTMSGVEYDFKKDPKGTLAAMFIDNIVGDVAGLRESPEIVRGRIVRAAVAEGKIDFQKASSLVGAEEAKHLFGGLSPKEIENLNAIRTNATDPATQATVAKILEMKKEIDLGLHQDTRLRENLANLPSALAKTYTVVAEKMNQLWSGFTQTKTDTGVGKPEQKVVPDSDNSTQARGVQIKNEKPESKTNPEPNPATGPPDSTVKVDQTRGLISSEPPVTDSPPTKADVTELKKIFASATKVVTSFWDKFISPTKSATKTETIASSDTSKLEKKILESVNAEQGPSEKQTPAQAIAAKTLPHGIDSSEQQKTNADSEAKKVETPKDQPEKQAKDIAKNPSNENKNPVRQGIVERISNLFSGLTSLFSPSPADNTMSEAKQVGLRTIEKYLDRFTHSRFDEAANLTNFKVALFDHLNKNYPDGNPPIEAIKKFVDDYMPFWPDHGSSHGKIIAKNMVDTIERLTQNGFLKDFSSDDLASLMELSALVGLAHDAGNAFPTGDENRRNHDLVPSKLLFGSNIPALKDLADSIQSAVREIVADNDSPLTKKIRETANDPKVKAAYTGDEAARMETILVEMISAAGLSHGHLPGNPELGLANLNNRVPSYLQQVLTSHPAEVGKTDISSRYQGSVENSFMAWARGDTKIENSKSITKIFATTEGILNYADANRPRGAGGILAGAGQTQSILTIGADGTPKVHIVLTDPTTGKKILTEANPRQAGSLNVETMELSRTDSQGNPVFRVEVINNADPLAKQTGRVIGETFAYANRALEDVVKGKNPQLEVVLKGDAGQTLKFESQLKSEISDNLLRVLIANGRVPQKVLEDSGYQKDKPMPQSLRDYATDKYVKIKYLPVDPPRPVAQNEAVRAKLAAQFPLSNAEKAALAKQKGWPKEMLDGAGWVTLPEGTKLFNSGDMRGDVLLIQKGNVAIKPKEGSGKPDITQLGNKVDPTVLGGSSQLSGITDPGRNATVFVGRGGATFIVIPKRTADKTFNPENLATRPENLVEKLSNIKNPSLTKAKPPSSPAKPKNVLVEASSNRGPPAVPKRTIMENARSFYGSLKDSLFSMMRIRAPKSDASPDLNSKILSAVEYIRKIPLKSAEVLKEVTKNPNAKPKGLGDDPMVEASVRETVKLLENAKRDDGVAYADHPIRLALLLNENLTKLGWSKQEIAEAMSYALNHDNLEEGPGGVTKSTAKALMQILYDATGDAITAKKVALSSVILTEPQLDYTAVTKIDDPSVIKNLEKVALVNQIADVIASNPEYASALLASAIADKVTNLVDYAHITQSKTLTPKQIAEKLAYEYASIQYALNKYEQAAKNISEPTQQKGIQHLLDIAKSAMDAQLDKYKVDRKEFANELKKFESLWNDNAETLRPAIGEYIKSYEDALNTASPFKTTVANKIFSEGSVKFKFIPKTISDSLKSELIRIHESGKVINGKYPREDIVNKYRQARDLLVEHFEKAQIQNGADQKVARKEAIKAAHKITTELIKQKVLGNENLLAAIEASDNPGRREHRMSDQAINEILNRAGQDISMHSTAQEQKSPALRNSDITIIDDLNKLVELVRTHDQIKAFQSHNNGPISEKSKTLSRMYSETIGEHVTALERDFDRLRHSDEAHQAVDLSKVSRKTVEEKIENLRKLKQTESSLKKTDSVESNNVARLFKAEIKATAERALKEIKAVQNADEKATSNLVSELMGFERDKIYATLEDPKKAAIRLNQIFSKAMDAYSSLVKSVILRNELAREFQDYSDQFLLKSVRDMRKIDANSAEGKSQLTEFALKMLSEKTGVEIDSSSSEKREKSVSLAISTLEQLRNSAVKKVEDIRKDLNKANKKLSDLTESSYSGPKITQKEISDLDAKLPLLKDAGIYTSEMDFLRRYYEYDVNKNGPRSSHEENYHRNIMSKFHDHKLNYEKLKLSEKQLSFIEVRSQKENVDKIQSELDKASKRVDSLTISSISNVTSGVPKDADATSTQGNRQMSKDDQKLLSDIIQSAFDATNVEQNQKIASLAEGKLEDLRAAAVTEVEKIKTELSKKKDKLAEAEARIPAGPKITQVEISDLDNKLIVLKKAGVLIREMDSLRRYVEWDQEKYGEKGSHIEKEYRDIISKFREHNLDPASLKLSEKQLSFDEVRQQKVEVAKKQSELERATELVKQPSVSDTTNGLESAIRAAQSRIEDPFKLTAWSPSREKFERPLQPVKPVAASSNQPETEVQPGFLASILEGMTNAVKTVTERFAGPDQNPETAKTDDKEPISKPQIKMPNSNENPLYYANDKLTALQNRKELLSRMTPDSQEAQQLRAEISRDVENLRVELKKQEAKAKEEYNKKDEYIDYEKFEKMENSSLEEIIAEGKKIKAEYKEAVLAKRNYDSVLRTNIELTREFGGFSPKLAQEYAKSASHQRETQLAKNPIHKAESKLSKLQEIVEKRKSSNALKLRRLHAEVSKLKTQKSTSASEKFKLKRAEKQLRDVTKEHAKLTRLVPSINDTSHFRDMHNNPFFIKADNFYQKRLTRDTLRQRAGADQDSDVPLVVSKINLPLPIERWRNSGKLQSSQQQVKKALAEPNRNGTPLDIKLKVSRADDVDALARKIAAPNDANRIKQIFQSELGKNVNLKGPIEIPLEKLMGSELEARLNSYEDSTESFERILKEKFTPLASDEPTKLGDLYVYRTINRSGKVVTFNAAMHVAEDIVYVKNGMAQLAPPTFQSRTEMESKYYSGENFSVSGLIKRGEYYVEVYRKNDPEQKQTPPEKQKVEFSNSDVEVTKVVGLHLDANQYDKKDWVTSLKDKVLTPEQIPILERLADDWRMAEFRAEILEAIKKYKEAGPLNADRTTTGAHVAEALGHTESKGNITNRQPTVTERLEPNFIPENVQKAIYWAQTYPPNSTVAHETVAKAIQENLKSRGIEATIETVPKSPNLLVVIEGNTAGISVERGKGHWLGNVASRLKASYSKDIKVGFDTGAFINFKSPYYSPTNKFISLDQTDISNMQISYSGGHEIKHALLDISSGNGRGIPEIEIVPREGALDRRHPYRRRFHAEEVTVTWPYTIKFMEAQGKRKIQVAKQIISQKFLKSQLSNDGKKDIEEAEYQNRSVVTPMKKELIRIYDEALKDGAIEKGLMPPNGAVVSIGLASGDGIYIREADITQWAKLRMPGHPNPKTDPQVIRQIIQASRNAIDGTGSIKHQEDSRMTAPEKGLLASAAESVAKFVEPIKNAVQVVFTSEPPIKTPEATRATTGDQVMAALVQPESKRNIAGDPNVQTEPINHTFPDYSTIDSQKTSKKLLDLARKQSGNQDATFKVRSDSAPYYQVNPKHVAGTPANREAKSASILPEDHVELFRKAIRDKRGDYWAIDSDGNFHRFEQSGGVAHWNGSTLLKKPGKPGSLKPTLLNPDPIDFDKIPLEIRRSFR